MKVVTTTSAIIVLVLIILPCIVQPKKTWGSHKKSSGNYKRVPSNHDSYIQEVEPKNVNDDSKNKKGEKKGSSKKPNPGDYKVGTDQDWEEYEKEFIADDLFQLIISKKRNVTFEQKIENITDETKVYMNFMSYTMEDKPLTINFQIFDQNDK